MYVIGIDIGTSSTKGILIDSHMNVMAQKSIPHTIERPQAGWAEQDAELWWQETVTIIKSLLTQSQVYPSSVKAIGCSGVCPVIVPIDKDGNSLRQAILYSIDTRATAEIAEMKQIFGEQYILEDSGHPLSYQAILPKMMWVKKNEPDVWKNATSFLGATGFVNYRLSGKTSIDHFTAADGGLGYSIKARKWNKDVFKQLNIDERLFPDIYWPYEKIGTLTKEAAQLTGLIEGISIIAGTGDALSEMISTGVSNVGETSLLYGSTLTTMSIIDDYWFHEGFITVPGWKDGQVVTSAVLGSGMSSFTWLSHLLGKENNIELFNELEPQVVEIQDSNHNIVFLPYLTGLRSPEINPLMKGTIVGINQAHTSPYMFKALMEGLGFALNYILEELDVIEVESVHAVGGGVNSKTLLQTVSHICGIDQKVIKGHVGAPLGSAWLAGYGVQMFSENSYEYLIEIGQVISWDESIKERYSKSYQRFVNLKNTIEQYYI